jgi:hypothetical protein
VLAATAAVTVLLVGVTLLRTPGTNPAVGGPARPSDAQRYNWQTDVVSLQAETFAITAGGKSFHGVEPIDLKSDPGTTTYETLELVWREHGVEMRLNIYFAADASDWWATEIRTYNGESPGDWISYQGRFFETTLGGTYTGDLDLGARDARLLIGGLRLQAFRGPDVAPATACADGRWPATQVSCTAALVDGPTSTGSGDIDLIWLTTLSAVRAAYPGVLPVTVPRDLPVWLILHLGASDVLRVVDATRVGPAIYVGPGTNETTRLFPPIAAGPHQPSAALSSGAPSQAIAASTGPGTTLYVRNGGSQMTWFAMAPAGETKLADGTGAVGFNPHDMGVACLGPLGGRTLAELDRAPTGSSTASIVRVIDDGTSGLSLPIVWVDIAADGTMSEGHGVPDWWTSPPPAC